MENLIIEATLKTPAVNFDANSGMMHITGKSIPEDTFLFYQALVNWFKVYLEKPNAITTFYCKLEYINTSSSKRIIHLLNMLQLATDQKKTLGKIKWKTEKEDDDMKDTGEEMKNMFTMSFEISN